MSTASSDPNPNRPAVKAPPPPSIEPCSQGAWRRFRDRHLFDYTAAASRLWLAISLGGALALVWALSTLAEAHAADRQPLWPVLLGMGLVAAAAMFPVKIPRTSYTVLVADVFIFAILAMLGAPAAVLAAGTEGLIGALRSSKRLSTRISAPAAAMAAFAVGGVAYSQTHLGLRGLGLDAGVAELAALCLVAALPVALTTGLLMTMAALKRGQWLQRSEWIGAQSWLVAMNLGAAFFAGLVQMNAARFGPAVLVIAVAATFGLVLLLRMTLSRAEAEHGAQEAFVASARRDAELSQQRFMAAFTHAAIGMSIVKPGGDVLQVNQALCVLLGRAADGIVGMPFESLLHAGDAALFNRQADELTRDDRPFSMEMRCHADDGRDLWVALHCSRYEDPGGAGHCHIYQLHDITSRHLAESRLQHIAFHDGLTDLANRTCFHERLELAVERSRLDPGERFAVLFLDLDRFKIVNDSLGHIAGNELLREVARRLATCVRPNDLVARLGGDEFAILLEALHDADDGMRLAGRVLAALSQPVSINGTEVLPGASVGITFSDHGYRVVDEVLRDADLAMYAAKAAGRGRVALFDITMHEQVAEKLALEADLRHAIGAGQLSVQFQPLFELEPYRLSGFEALARWTHPQRGNVSPAVFITLAEESGHIEALSSWVIDHAVQQLAEWHRCAPHMAHLNMHVNISGRDLARADLPAHVEAVLKRHGLPGRRLTLEITETTLMGRLDVALQTMEQLRKLGVRFSIDDFGTGYSSLAYLSRLPIDSLKIDRSFITELQDKPQNMEIVRAVLSLGQSLSRKVIAEGVETIAELAALRSLGVPFGQGYLLSRPLDAAQVPALLFLGATAVP